MTGNSLAALPTFYGFYFQNRKPCLAYGGRLQLLNSVAGAF